MPLEVSEIGISMRVTNDGEPEGDRPLDRNAVFDDEMRKNLIDECVERVLQALKAERER